MNSVAFTSDTHYAHENIIKYSNRPFANVNDMNDALVAGIHKVLPNGGTLYHMGDWSMSKIDFAYEFMKRINPNIEVILTYGNHDTHKLKHEAFKGMFKEIHRVLETKVNHKRITMCHNAWRTWEKMEHGAWMLYGHSHGNLPDDPNARSMDVGVDVAYKLLGEYRPFTFKEIEDFMSKKNFVPNDHHGR